MYVFQRFGKVTVTHTHTHTHTEKEETVWAIGAIGQLQRAVQLADSHYTHTHTLNSEHSINCHGLCVLMLQFTSKIQLLQLSHKLLCLQEREREREREIWRERYIAREREPWKLL